VFEKSKIKVHDNIVIANQQKEKDGNKRKLFLSWNEPASVWSRTVHLVSGNWTVIPSPRIHSLSSRDGRHCRLHARCQVNITLHHHNIAVIITLVTTISRQKHSQ